ncbi:MAG TPA: MarR family transcriptional regulator [Thermoanaerobaculia bacterium]|nr:MarR family transcriptional regulator [Thermoanaerobaculia bacterium]
MVKTLTMSDRDLVTAVLQLANLLNRRLSPIFDKSKITPQQWAVLAVLSEYEEPTTLAAIAKKLLVTKQNMTGMISRLADLGLVDRNDDPKDLRSSRVELTRRGRSIVEKLRPAYEQWRDALAREISERDLQTVQRTLDRLIEHLD